MNNTQLIEFIKSFLNLFLDELIMTNKSKNTIASYNCSINSFCDFLSDYNEINFSDLKKIDVLNFLKFKNNTLQKHEEQTISSKKLYVIHLKTFFNFILDNSTETLDAKKVFNLKFKSKKSAPKGLNERTVQSIVTYLDSLNINSFENARISLIIKLFLFSGARRDELRNICLDDFTLKNELYIIKTLGKGSKERTLYINESFIKKELEFYKSNNIYFIAVSKNKKILDGSQIYKLVKTLFKKLHIDFTGVHTLRHTFAKSMINKNVNITVVKELLGHESIQTTMIYTNPNETTIVDNYQKAFK